MGFLTDEEYIKKFKLKPRYKILDIGGSAKQHDKIQIDTIVDILPPEKIPYSPSSLTAKHFVKVDITREKLPFKDKEFDFCFCTHTLEDLHNPFLAIEEMARVAKRGFISTPSRGKDMQFSHFDMTDWLTGPRRVPGYAHHWWFFEKKKDMMVITPKNYPLLYTNEFQITEWKGAEEFRFEWNGQIKYKVFESTSFHDLIDNYRHFMQASKDMIKTGMPVVFLDSPSYIIKETIKMFLKRGEGFKHKQNSY